MSPFTDLIKDQGGKFFYSGCRRRKVQYRINGGSLFKRGFRVYTALCANATIDIFKQYLPDLVVLDVMMPGMDLNYA